MKKIQASERKQPWHKKPKFGSLYVMKGSKYIYISLNYYKQRLRFPSDLEDTSPNWEKLCEFLEQVGEKIKNRTFCFAKSFYWLDEKTKSHFTQLEGGDYKPAPEHVQFGDFAEVWMKQKIPTFYSATKQRDYAEALNSRILPYFKNMTFASITAGVVETFIDNLKRCNGTQKSLSVKRIKNIMGPMSKVWIAACKEHNWILNNPFLDMSSKYKEVKDKELQEQERLALLMDDDEVIDVRDVFLLEEWECILKEMDPHYHAAMELLLRGMIASELEGLLKRHVKDDVVNVRCVVIREKDGKKRLKFKPKNWYRRRSIPLTGKLKKLIKHAADCSRSNTIISFDNDIALPANEFLLTMKDGSPFNYKSFRKTVWDKAATKIGLDGRVPYAARHTFVQWSLLIGVNKNRLVDLMGHSTKKMIDEVYGFYRNGLIEERQQILDYLGEDFLALEEIRTAFPERYQRKMTLANAGCKTSKAPDSPATFCQSFGQSRGLYSDNYM